MSEASDETRQPTIDDLVQPCRALNARDVRWRIEIREVQEVKIPFASAGLLLETKQTWREKDKIDASFLRGKMGQSS